MLNRLEVKHKQIIAAVLPSSVVTALILIAIINVIKNPTIKKEVPIEEQTLVSHNKKA
ncbi:hypothetical protein MIDIC_10029 [Alphaproteobacteria bacterium]